METQIKDSAADQTAGLVSETDANLLTLMSWKELDLKAAQAAGSEFYQRHRRYVYKVCLKAAQRYSLGSDCAQDLTAATFARVWQFADQFVYDNTLSGEAARRHVLGWVGAITNNVVMDALRGREATPEQLLAAVAWQQQCAHVQSPDSPEVALVRRAISESLTEREREVVRVTLLSYKIDAKHQRLANDDATELAHALQTTPDNLRKIRKRAFQKVREYLTRHRIGNQSHQGQAAEEQP